MNVYEKLESTLGDLPCLTGRAPVQERPDVYVAWFEVLAQGALHASNGIRRVEHLMQVDIYSKPPLDKLRDEVLTRLQKAGFVLSDWGPEDYESDTQYRHLPIRIRWHSKGVVENE